MDRFVVLGGSSPFTAGLIDALENAGDSLPPHELVLNGRDAESLARVAQYAGKRLLARGWRVVAETLLPKALEGANVVLHQIRYGGMDGRAEDEAIALRFAIPPDETLGPAGLNALLRTSPGLRLTAEALARVCPDAWVLNMTNPLSIVTALMAEAGVSRCVGLCELPRVTAMRAARALAIPFDEIEWAYLGLNHRGFIVELRRGDMDLIPELALSLGGQPFEGVLGTEIARLQAVPTKYFRLFREGDHSSGGRAAFLSSLRERIFQELAGNPDRSPPGLDARYMEWYPESVVPMLAALGARERSAQVVNLRDSDGLVREALALVSRDGIEPTVCAAPKGEVARWLERFERNERAVLAAARSPSLRSVVTALETDPLVPASKVEPVADAIWENAGDARRTRR